MFKNCSSLFIAIAIFAFGKESSSFLPSLGSNNGFMVEHQQSTGCTFFLECDYQGEGCIRAVLICFAQGMTFSVCQMGKLFTLPRQKSLF